MPTHQSIKQPGNATKSIRLMVLIAGLATSLSVLGCGGDGNDAAKDVSKDAVKDSAKDKSSNASPNSPKEGDSKTGDIVKTGNAGGRDDSRNAVVKDVLSLANQAIATLKTIEDKESALATLTSLKEITLQTKTLSTRWLAIGIPSKAEMLLLKDNYSDEMKATGIEAGKTLIVLTKRWKAGEIKAGITTIAKITKAVNDIRKSLNIFGTEGE